MTGRSRVELYGVTDFSHIVVRNAVAVQNIGRTPVGHIPRQTAAKLAPLLDAGLITVEGTMNEGNCESTFTDLVPSHG